MEPSRGANGVEIRSSPKPSAPLFSASTDGNRTPALKTVPMSSLSRACRFSMDTLSASPVSVMKPPQHPPSPQFPPLHPVIRPSQSVQNSPIVVASPFDVQYVHGLENKLRSKTREVEELRLQLKLMEEKCANDSQRSSGAGEESNDAIEFDSNRSISRTGIYLTNAGVTAMLHEADVSNKRLRDRLLRQQEKMDHLQGRLDEIDQSPSVGLSPQLTKTTMSLRLLRREFNNLKESFDTFRQQINDMFPIFIQKVDEYQATKALSRFDDHSTEKHKEPVTIHHSSSSSSLSSRSPSPCPAPFPTPSAPPVQLGSEHQNELQNRVEFLEAKLVETQDALIVSQRMNSRLEPALMNLTAQYDVLRQEYEELKAQTTSFKEGYGESVESCLATPKSQSDPEPIDELSEGLLHLRPTHSYPEKGMRSVKRDSVPMILDSINDSEQTEHQVPLSYTDSVPSSPSTSLSSSSSSSSLDTTSSTPV